MDIKDKISKLLALSESPNEHEAQLALQKAKELMTQHRLSVEDLTPQSRVIHRETDVTFSKRRDSWTLALAGVIAENYCCRAFSRRRSGMQTRKVCFAGFPADIELCERVFRYALDCVKGWIANTTRRNKSLYSAQELSALSNSYAKGYIAGVYTSLRKQQKDQQEWGLIASPRSEVDESVRDLRTERVAGEDEIVKSIYLVGFKDGVQFSVSDKLEGRGKE